MLRLLTCGILFSISVSFGQTGTVSPTSRGTAGSAIQQFPAARRTPSPNPVGQQQPTQPPGAIEGSVTSMTTGEPLKSARLILMPMEPRSNASTPFTTLSDANGQFVMGNLPPGTYRLMAERNGYVRTNYKASTQTQPGSTLTVSTGQTLKGVDLRMQPHAVLAGRIVDEEGEPLANVQVQALSQRYMQGRRQLMPAGMSSTNDLGEYRIFGLAPGKYLVNAIHRSNGMVVAGAMSTAGGTNDSFEEEGYAPTFYPGTSDATAAVPLQLEPGQPVTNIDFKLRRVRTVRISGKVIGPAQQARTMVMLVQQNDTTSMGSRNMTSTHGQDGSFEIRGVIPGAYHLLAQQTEQNRQSVGRIPLTVGHANIDNIEIVIQPGVPVTGQVKVEGATTVNLALSMISLQPKELTPFGGGASAAVGPDGSFSIPNVSPNTYRVMAGMRGAQPLYVKAVYAGQQELPSHEVTVSEGAAPMLTVVMAAPTSSVSGQLISNKPAGSEPATIVLVPPVDKRDRQDLYRVATTDQQGKFAMQLMPPGEYTLYAWDQAEPGSWMDPEFLARFENQGKKINVKENEGVTADVPLLKVADTQ